MSSDTSNELDAWKHADCFVRENYGHYDVFLSVPPTAPLRSFHDVQKCIDTLTGSNDFDLVLTGYKSQHSPYFNMVHIDKDNGTCFPIIKNHGVHRRQDAPTCFQLSTCAYACRSSVIQNLASLWDLKVGLVEVSPETAVDIDTSIDLKLANLLYLDS